ncbi:MAG: TetR/AcrR family transcriptional regulator [Phycisphaerae bacterium]|jgi:AcrR family transcriptional regulator
MATDETIKRILDAAGPIFADKGFREAHVRDICEAAGVGLASVNYHFGDKNQLYVRVVEAAFEYVIQNEPTPTWPPGTPLTERMRTCIHDLARRTLRPKDESWQERLLTREIHAPTPGCEGVIHKHINEHLQPLTALLNEVLPADLPDIERWRYVLTITGQILHYDSHRDVIAVIIGEAADGPAFSAEALAEHITRFTLAALGLAPTLGQQTGSDPS